MKAPRRLTESFRDGVDERYQVGEFLGRRILELWGECMSAHRHQQGAASAAPEEGAER